jgi:hypothetical protein
MEWILSVQTVAKMFVNRNKQVFPRHYHQQPVHAIGRLHRYKPMLPFVLLQTNAVSLRSEPSSRTALKDEQSYS